MSKRIQNLESRIAKREERIASYEAKKKEEQKKLAEEKQQLIHLKYNNVLQKMAEEGVTPDEALQAIELVASEDKEEQTTNEVNHYENTH